MKTLLFVLAISFSMTCAFGLIQAQTALKIRVSPSSQSIALGLLAPNATVQIDCQAIGEEITNGPVKSNLWYHIPSRKGYISAAYASKTEKPFPACNKTAPKPSPKPSTNSTVIPKPTPKPTPKPALNLTVIPRPVPKPAVNNTKPTVNNTKPVNATIAPKPAHISYNCSGGLKTNKTCAQAVAWAESKLSTVPTEEFSRKADRFVGNAYGKARSGFESAMVHWEATPQQHKHADRNPPAGALVYFKTGTSSYVALSTGNGALIGTDIGGVGTVTRTSIAGVETKWRGVYLGWTAPYFKN